MFASALKTDVLGPLRLYNTGKHGDDATARQLIDNRALLGKQNSRAVSLFWKASADRHLAAGNQQPLRLKSLRY